MNYPNSIGHLFSNTQSLNVSNQQLRDWYMFWISYRQISLSQHTNPIVIKEPHLWWWYLGMWIGGRLYSIICLWLCWLTESIKDILNIWPTSKEEIYRILERIFDPIFLMGTKKTRDWLELQRRVKMRSVHSFWQGWVLDELRMH